MKSYDESTTDERLLLDILHIMLEADNNLTNSNLNAVKQNISKVIVLIGDRFDI